MAQLTFVAGDVLTASQLNTYCMGEGGGWTSYTPNIVQSGAVTSTVSYSKYARYGRTIHWTFALAVTSAGTAANNVTVSLPVTAASTASAKGSGFIYDASTTTIYNGSLSGLSTTTVTILVDGASSGTGWGAFPNLALASGDEFSGTITYEAAS